MKHRALIVGAGRIGAGWKWNDDEYTHAGAYRALADRVELVGFVEPSLERANAAKEKWGWLDNYTSLDAAFTHSYPIDIVSICTQPDQQYSAIIQCIKAGVKAIWCEKPYQGPKELMGVPVQVNYMRRGDPIHQFVAANTNMTSSLVVYGKDDIHTKCHFEDLAAWWKCSLDYRPFNGPCAYIVTGAGSRFFDNGGVDGGQCFKAMLGNLLDHVDNGTPLWSPAT